MKMIGIPFLAKIISNLSLGFFSPVPWYRDSLASISTWKLRCLEHQMLLIHRFISWNEIQFVDLLPPENLPYPGCHSVCCKGSVQNAFDRFKGSVWSDLDWLAVMVDDPTIKLNNKIIQDILYPSPAWRSGCHQNHTGSLTPWRENYIEGAQTNSCLLTVSCCPSECAVKPPQRGWGGRRWDKHRSSSGRRWEASCLRRWWTAWWGQAWPSGWRWR